MIISLERQSPKVLISFILAIICLPMRLQADEEFGWYFTEGGIGVDSYWGGATEIVIPDEIGGYPVVEINYYPACIWDTYFKVLKPEIVNSVTIPSSVIRIPEPAPFWGITALSAILVSAENSHFSSLDGVLLNKDKTSLLEFPTGRDGEYIIPDSVESIEARAFYFCRLSSVIIPDNVTYIGEWSFFACTNLTSLYFMGEPPTLGTSVFYFTDEIPSELVIYYAEGTPGWGTTFDGIPTTPFTPWGNYVPITSDQGTHTDTGNWLGILEITHDPWVWCESVPCWFNICEATANAGQGWLYPPNQDSLLISEISGTPWGYSFTLKKWIFLTGSGWAYLM